MRILIDTHIYLWWLEDSPLLSIAARKAIANAAAVYVSSASLWEAMIKIGLNRLDVDPDDLVAGIRESGFSELPITSTHTVSLLKLGTFHKDPFDRMLIAQALSEPLYLITSDSVLAQYSDLIITV